MGHRDGGKHSTEPGRFNKRVVHTLKPNHGTESPTNCIFFDTETYFEGSKETTLYHHLKFGYACYTQRDKDHGWCREDWLRFDAVSQFWDWVYSKTRPKTKLFCFCHNTSFDLPVLDVFRQLPSRGFRLVSAIIDAPPTILRYRTDTKCDVVCRHPYHTSACKARRAVARTIIIIDSLNLFRMPLKELGKEIGLEKYDMPDDNDLGVDWETYGRRDVEILRDALFKWLAFLKDNDLGSFAPTLAGQSMRAYRHKYMRHQIMIDDNVGALDLTREGYYGGRNEAYFIGRSKDKYWLLDVNSMYPAVMAREEFPYKLTTFTRYAEVSDLDVWCATRCVTARVTLTTDKAFAPYRMGRKLVFPLGTFSCILSTPELRYARTHAEILKIHEVAIYERAPLFSQMMHELYAMRLQYKAAGNPVYAFLARKLMNSFYGKWGQNGFKWFEIGEAEDLTPKRWPEVDADNKTVRYLRQIGGLLQQRGDTFETRDSFPAIAAHVTAYARMVLFDLMLQAGESNVFYCDTDSLLVNEAGLNNLSHQIDSTSLGFLSVKGEYEDIEIFGCKDYVFGSKFRAKGVRNKALWLSRNTVEQDRWSGLRGLLAAGVLDTASTRTVRKVLKRRYDKAIVQANGRVIPYLMSGDTILNSGCHGLTRDVVL